MALNPSNSSNLDQLAFNGLTRQSSEAIVRAVSVNIILSLLRRTGRECNPPTVTKLFQYGMIERPRNGVAPIRCPYASTPGN